MLRIFSGERSKWKGFVEMENWNIFLKLYTWNGLFYILCKEIGVFFAYESIAVERKKNRVNIWFSCLTSIRVIKLGNNICRLL